MTVAAYAYVSAHNNVKKVIRLAVRRGASVVIVDRVRFSDKTEVGTWSDCPFAAGIAINVTSKCVWLQQEASEQSICAGHLIHELGHLHAAPRQENIERADEWSWFGWEIAVAREARAMQAWTCSMADYVIPCGTWGGSDEFGAFTDDARREIIRNRIAHARERGIVDRDGRAIWRRTAKRRSV